MALTKSVDPNSRLFRTTLITRISRLSFLLIILDIASLIHFSRTSLLVKTSRVFHTNLSRNSIPVTNSAFEFRKWINSILATIAFVYQVFKNYRIAFFIVNRTTFICVYVYIHIHMCIEWGIWSVTKLCNLYVPCLKSNCVFSLNQLIYFIILYIKILRYVCKKITGLQNILCTLLKHTLLKKICQM